MTLAKHNRKKNKNTADLIGALTFTINRDQKSLYKVQERHKQHLIDEN